MAKGKNKTNSGKGAVGAAHPTGKEKVSFLIVLLALMYAALLLIIYIFLYFLLSGNKKLNFGKSVGDPRTTLVLRRHVSHNSCCWKAGGMYGCCSSLTCHNDDVMSFKSHLITTNMVDIVFVRTTDR